MSINSKQSVKCPKCGQMQDITVWSSITCDDSPDLKKELLAGKVNIFCCESCNTRALIPTPLLYTDHEKKLLFSFTPCTDYAEKMRYFENIKKTSGESGELKDYDGYILRFISDYDELLEKILIFDSNLHDKVISVLKVLILMQEPEKSKHRTVLFGKCDNNSIEFLVQDREENKFYTSNIPIESYETIKEQLRQSGVKYKSFDWEIIDVAYGESLLRGVNNNL